jgi:hypothetical protein
MRKLTIVALLCAGMTGAYAQTTLTAPKPAPTAPADVNAPLPGANSFTESQAKSRLAENGYTNVSALQKDDKGVWRGQATYDGKVTSVAVDYRGNIVRN